MSDRLFSPRFFIMCGFTFTVFLSAFQLLPTAPFRIHDLGGSTFASGLFLGFLTYASALSAPLTGAISDRLGRRRTLVVASTVILACAIAYAVTTSYRLMLVLVVVHGVFWSALLSASAAYLTGLLPERRRAEGIAYWGLSSVAAIAVAPPIAFWLLQHGGWRWICISCGSLNVLMGAIAWTLDRDQSPTHHVANSPTPLIEWRVLVLSLTLFLYSFGYGAITSFSAVYADAIGVSPKSLYLTVLAVVILLTRPLSGALGDRIGYRRIFIPSLVLIAAGLTILATGAARASLVWSAIVFGIGFGNAYPAFVAHVMRDVTAARRGAAFGAILAAFDTGVGTGSTSVGWLIERYGFSTAFGTAAVLSAIALPYFVVVDRRRG
jgi:predicted MFS family arabinose efflux permease